MNFRDKTAHQLHLLLDLPQSNGHPSQGRHIIRAIQDTITTALRRGESVSIPGFGIFKVVQGKPRRTGNNLITSDGIRSPVPLTHRARKYVTFTPAETMAAMLNHTGTLTWHERRAIEVWHKDDHRKR